MATPGGQPGNKNAQKGRIWTQAIHRALERRASRSETIKMIDEIADKLLDMALSGDISALREFGDRLEGKPNQSISSPDGGPVVTRIELVPLVNG